MEYEHYGEELSKVATLFNDNSVDEELGYPEDQEYYED